MGSWSISSPVFSTFGSQIYGSNQLLSKNYMINDIFWLVKDIVPDEIVTLWFKNQHALSNISLFFGCQSPRRLVQYFWTAAVTDLFRIHCVLARRSKLKGSPFAEGPRNTKHETSVFPVMFCPKSQKKMDGWDTIASQTKTKNNKKRKHNSTVSETTGKTNTSSMHLHDSKDSIRWECQHYHLQLDGMWNLVPFLVPNQRVEVPGAEKNPRRWRMCVCCREVRNLICGIWIKLQEMEVWMIMWAIKQTPWVFGRG